VGLQVTGDEFVPGDKLQFNVCNTFSELCILYFMKYSASSHIFRATDIIDIFKFI